MAIWDREEQLALIDKNSKDKIKITAVEKNSKKYVDIRIFFEQDDQLKPSQKGVVIPHEKLNEIVETINSYLEKEQLD